MCFAKSEVEADRGAKCANLRNVACATQEEISDAVEVPRQTITDWEAKFAENSEAEESANWTAFDVPIYNA